MSRTLPKIATRSALALAAALALASAGCNDPDGPSSPGFDVVRVVGALTDEGVECQAMRGDDGVLYTLGGDLRGAEVGDRVRVAGRIAEGSICQQGTTLDVESIEILDD